jgi:hypothetical protein
MFPHRIHIIVVAARVGLLLALPLTDSIITILYWVNSIFSASPSEVIYQVGIQQGNIANLLSFKGEEELINEGSVPPTFDLRSNFLDYDGPSNFDSSSEVSV